MSEEFERHHAAPEACGTCKHHLYEPIDCDWICTCDESDYLADWTDYNDSCECWEARA